MFKAMILLKRREGTSRSEFTQWWLEDHQPLAKTLPGLRRAIFNLADDASADVCDGISELWFDSHADFEAAYASDLGKAVAEDSMKNVGSRNRMFVTEHIIKE